MLFCWFESCYLYSVAFFLLFGGCVCALCAMSVCEIVEVKGQRNAMPSLSVERSLDAMAVQLIRSLTERCDESLPLSLQSGCIARAQRLRQQSMVQLQSFTFSKGGRPACSGGCLLGITGATASHRKTEYCNCTNLNCSQYFYRLE